MADDRLARNIKIADAYNAGKSLRSISARWRLSYRQIYRVLRALGIWPRGWQ